ncbi:uncharacterized protein SCODWIG_00626 [Saccharomycodes ludwigii]|uniref:Uncharacterized protein n=1 Tax=Saccharomycodes ludwigii TaxID=36035 RepID=A0A376B2F6_9ASCO|nr:hypothetical protein SCDLUD_004865 [Saccharomycodes ludwigii]KAH3899422.1 hypothetical protein SCDLUD_004865 [Saccharomycodes ludwigii]SSD58865.1 uncharacterized protein SCODWIG_00626 [Saccharomycodes ludwigii]
MHSNSEEFDSDLQNDRESSSTNHLTTQSSKNNYDNNEISDEESANSFIGGSNVSHSKKNSIVTEDIPTNKNFKSKINENKRRKSIYEESSDSEDILSKENVSDVKHGIGTSKQQQQEDEEDEDERGEKNHRHKIFTFTVPFGGTSTDKNYTKSEANIIDVKSKNNAMVRKLNEKLPTPTSSSSLGPVHIPSKHEIKLKLKKQQSISSLEERILFANQKGLENDRFRAFKKFLKPERVISTVQELENVKLSSVLNSLEFDNHEVSKSSNKDISSGNTENHSNEGYDMHRVRRFLKHELSGDVIILGGYRGSTLREAKDNNRIWIPLKAGIKIKKVNLIIGPQDSDEIKTQKQIKPDGMLTHVGPIDIAKRLINKLSKNPKVNIRDFGYDWRLSLDITSEELHDFILKIQEKRNGKESKGKGVFIIAHSMGGLLAHYVLQKYTNLIRGIIYVGCPSQCPDILGPLRFGDQVLWNTSILSAEANFFMRSSFYFLPQDGRCFVNEDTFERYDLDFFDPETWCKYGLSPLVDKNRRKFDIRQKKRKSRIILTDLVEKLILSDDEREEEKRRGEKVKNTSSDKEEEEGEEEGSCFHTSYEDCVDYLKRVLPRVNEFLNFLNYIPNKKYPPLAIVYGNTVPTVRGAKFKNKNDIKLGDYSKFYYGPGDGVVHHKWLLPEHRGFPLAAKIQSPEGHVSLMTDHDAIAKAFISIVDNE